MIVVPRPASSLFYRLRMLRIVLPLAFSLTAFTYEIFEHRPSGGTPLSLFAGEAAIYTIFCPVLIYMGLTWLLHRVVERDAAEARLTALYELSHESAGARSLGELHDIALSIPERCGLPGAACILIAQDSPGRPWLLLGARGLSDADKAAIEAALTTWREPECPKVPADGTHVLVSCPPLVELCLRMASLPQQVLGLSLSREPSRNVILGVCLGARLQPSPQTIDTLESMAAGLAMALDRASFRARERQLLQHVQRDVAGERLGLIPTLERMLADIVDEHPVEAAGIYLLRDEGRRLTCVVSWPEPRAGELLSRNALGAVAASRTDAWPRPDFSALPERGAAEPEVVAVPITDEGAIQGALVLAGQADVPLPHRSILDVVAGMMGLLIRNSELYARLETQAVLEERSHLAREVHDGLAQALGFFNFKVQLVQRLLGRGDLDEARIALQELRSGSQEVYDEVRQLVRDLSGPADEADDFADRLERYCAAFTRRTGLQVSLDAACDANLQPEARYELFRVVQEALNNAQRHARASQVCVRLCGEAQGVVLTVEDDGAGMPSESQGGDHFGLQIMRERVRSIRGDLQVVSRGGQGTVLQVWVPAQPAGEPQEEGLWSGSVS